MLWCAEMALGPLIALPAVLMITSAADQESGAAVSAPQGSDLIDTCEQGFTSENADVDTQPSQHYGLLADSQFHHETTADDVTHHVAAGLSNTERVPASRITEAEPSQQSGKLHLWLTLSTTHRLCKAICS